ncbi:unnamed protein product [Acanthoscelides obtectus]|uniref:5'-3' exoribonuclease 1 n=1 Tax=Acanthoscelides obtectus TaxID=200917 RepID=A0A9P0Q6H2_ACAOB|nr:unnamed protein product [Acanthoscelides obtectus]CAK1672522.1 5'-3' exoribonuclease 1 [Acanthoscelides obtectus]
MELYNTRLNKTILYCLDGVAPRAKMNQQRGRRFRSAKDAEKQTNQAIQRGETLPEEARFDSNCITPGTVFMARLHEQLKYLVVDKISNDPLWQQCTIILSGHETPGEGEHKIMDYIRYMRSQPGYDPNTRHCLYGLDADLIMLGLCTHEPHFSLLREEVKFGKKSKRTSVPEETTFFLLHLSLMREYLELEFMPLKDKLKGFEFDLEKIIDDWVLMGFLVGNDFIPHLPNMHIANGALPILYKAYIDTLPQLDGYINEAGTLNLTRFEKFMKSLSAIDFENFEEIRDDLLYMETKMGRKICAHSKVSTRQLEEWESQEPIDQTLMGSLEPEKQPRDSGLAALIKNTDDLLLESEEEDDHEEISDEDDAFNNYKMEYYKNKLEYDKVTPEVMRDQAEGYVRAIQWNLNYYYNGCCSWSWYYPHHYAPYISDIKGFSNQKIEFDMGKPFMPFEQLLAVLPSACKELLPKAYHGLMTEDHSIIKKYYPEEFETDLNGKKQDWEAVVLVPFIDEKLLLEAMKSCNEMLTDEELKRNSHGPMLIYKHTNIDKGPYIAPEYFPPIPHNYTDVKTMRYTDVLLPKEKIVKGLYPEVKLDVYYPGFPTMKHLKYKGELRKAKVKVFEQPSRSENMIITIIPDDDLIGDYIPVDLLGSNVFVGWPHMVEARVVAISNSRRKYVSRGGEQYNVEEKAQPQVGLFCQEIAGATEIYQRRLGIDVGDTKVLVQVQVLIGRKYMFTPNGRLTLEKQFAQNTSEYPLQTVVFNIPHYDSGMSTFRDVEQVFPVDSICFTITNPYYGSYGVIQDSSLCARSGRIKMCVSVLEEPDLAAIRDMHLKSVRNYKTLHNVSSQLSMSHIVFTRITGSIFLSVPNDSGGFQNVNIALDLKLNKKNKETPGYTRKIGATWCYTDKVAELVREYCEQFPEVMHYLSKDPNFGDIRPEEVFGPDYSERLQSLLKWLKSSPAQTVEKQTCGSLFVESEVVAELEKLVDHHKTSTSKKVTMQIKPSFLYKPEVQNGTLPPDPKCETRILDRIVNVRSGFSVPFALKGTVIGIKNSPTGNDRDVMYDVLFDKPFKDGMKFDSCTSERGYRIPKTAFLNISYGQRLMIEKTGRTDDIIAKAEASYHPHYNPNRQQQPADGSIVNTFQQPQQPSWIPPQLQPLVQQQARPPNPVVQPGGSAFAHFRNEPPTQNHKQFQSEGQGQQPQLYRPPQRQEFYRPTMGEPATATYQQPRNHALRPNDVYRPPRERQQQQQQGFQKYDITFMPSFMDKNTSQSIDETFASAVQSTSKRSENRGTELVEPKRGQTIDTDFLKTILKIGESNNKQSIPPKETKSVEKKKNESNATPGFSFDMLSQVANAPASTRLVTYYQSNGLDMPRYQYFSAGNNLIKAQITLNDEHFVGKPAKTKDQASDEVANVVLKHLMSKVS